MKRLEMTDLQTTGKVRGEKRTLLVPGGWNAVIPEVTPDPTSLRAFTRYLREEGLTEYAAQQQALATIQGAFESGYIRGIRHMLYARAQEYAERYPHLVTEEGTLQGFDPAELQAAYFPFDRPGRRGKVYADTAMATMAKEAAAESA